MGMAPLIITPSDPLGKCLLSGPSTVDSFLWFWMKSWATSVSFSVCFQVINSPGHTHEWEERRK